MADKVWLVQAKLPDTPEVKERVELAIRHDYLVYQGKGMQAENLSEWIRFLINRRLTEIVQGVK